MELTFDICWYDFNPLYVIYIITIVGNITVYFTLEHVFLQETILVQTKYQHIYNKELLPYDT